MRRTLMLGVATATLLASAGLADAGPLARSTGTAAGFSVHGINGSYIYFILRGTLSFGGVTETGSFSVGDVDGKTVITHDYDTGSDVVGTCVDGTTVQLEQAPPAKGVLACVGHFPG